MIRRVAFRKAVLAGAIGALAWEVVIRILLLAGLPMFDLVGVLGKMVFGPDAAFGLWWPAGHLMHAVVGSIWAVFYAYFFWSLYEVKPFLQGMAFSLVPALLAGLIMIPQMDLMQATVLDASVNRFGAFAVGIGWLGPVSVLLGHLIYGAAMGAIYTKETDYIMLFMNEGALKELLEDKLELGAGASFAAGPVGRTAGASTNATLDAGILTWSMSEGAFIGAALKGAVITEDGSMNKAVYGMNGKNVLANPGQVKMSELPIEITNFPKTVARYAGGKTAGTK